jgi:hypothetical protein
MRIAKQQGSALIVSLIMLTSVTFLAILSLQGSTTQIRIVSNLQIKEDVFHTSKRELNSQYDGYRNQISKIQEMSDAMTKSVSTNSAGDVTPNLDLTPILDTNNGEYVLSSSLRYFNKVPVNLNYNFAKDSSVTTMSWLPFEITSETTDSSARFHSNQRLGFKYNVPSAGR